MANRPTVIRIKTMMKKEDYDNLEKRIKQQNPNVIVIPHNAELVTPADRPQGEWVWHEDEDICNCSECEFEIDATGCIEPMEYVGVFHYCPNCGAHMKGADDDTR